MLLHQPEQIFPNLVREKLFFPGFTTGFKEIPQNTAQQFQYSLYTFLVGVWIHVFTFDQPHKSIRHSFQIVQNWAKSHQLTPNDLAPVSHQLDYFKNPSYDAFGFLIPLSLCVDLHDVEHVLVGRDVHAGWQLDVQD